MDDQERDDARRRFVEAGPPKEWAVVDADGRIPLLDEAPWGTFKTRAEAEAVAARRPGSTVEEVVNMTTLHDERPVLIAKAPPWERLKVGE